MHARTHAYLVEQGEGVWEGVLAVGGLVGDLEGGLAGVLGADPGEVQEAEDEALDPSCLQAYQEASGTVEHLKTERII